MATAAVQVPSSNRVVSGSCPLAAFSYPEPLSTLPSDPKKVVTEWVSSFNKLVQSQNFEVASLFLKESFWRDLLCLTWDFHTLKGVEKIESLIKNQKDGWRIKSVSIDDSSDLRKPTVAPFDFGGNLKGVQSFLKIETNIGKGRGLVKLLQNEAKDGGWKAFTLFTVLQELTGFEESTNERRPTGAEHGSHIQRQSWSERRAVEQNFEEGIEPTALVVGIHALA